MYYVDIILYVSWTSILQVNGCFFMNTGLFQEDQTSFILIV